MAKPYNDQEYLDLSRTLEHTICALREIEGIDRDTVSDMCDNALDNYDEDNAEE